jgi:hypothetical protein
MPELWTPGPAGPLDQLVDRIHRSVEDFAAEHALAQAAVQIDLVDGSTIDVAALSAEPGFGLVTIRPHGEEPELLIVPVGTIRRIAIRSPEERTHLGFSLPESA